MYCIDSLPTIAPNGPQWEFALNPSGAPGSHWARLNREELPTALTALLPFKPNGIQVLNYQPTESEARISLLFLWKHRPTPALQKTRAPDLAAHLGTLLGALIGCQSSKESESDPLIAPAVLLDNLEVGVVVIDLETRRIQTNRTAAKLLGIPAGISGSAAFERKIEELSGGACMPDRPAEAAGAPAWPTAAPHAFDWKLPDRTLQVQSRALTTERTHRQIWTFKDITASAKREEVLRKEASHDPMTGLLNRRSWLRRVKAYRSDPVHQGEAHTILMLDVDHFKDINDQHGHPIGDQVLATISKRLAAILRTGDMLARYGGEEFILFAPGVFTHNAKVLADRLRLQIADIPVRTDTGTEIRCTVSIGGTILDSTQGTLQEAIKRADTCLYHAKRMGRNTIILDNDI